MKYKYLKIIDSLYQDLNYSNNSLMHGNAGLCFFLYHLARSANNPEYEELADNLLGKTFDNLSTAVLPDFENGLAGIGWVVEHLVQNGFAEGNTDEILEEVDNKVFKLLNETNLTSFELTSGLSGYLFYLIARLKKPANPKSMAQWINRELLILVINKLDEIVTTQFPSITKEMYFDLFWRFPVLFYGLAEAFDLNIYSEKIRCMVNQWVMSLEAYLPSMHINRLYMATVLTLIKYRVPNKRIEKQIQILLFATDFDTLKTEVDSQALNIRFGWPGVVWLLYQASRIIPANYPNYRLIDLTRKEIIQKYKVSLEKDFTTVEANSKQFGISEGLAGIGLMELLWPEILEGNEN
ncbi:lanthionine synthetase LanC family protein [Mangrovibacterium marinum]|uniref:lanthionine synthetase LanC family protein n=1 Tax=Mangrovibacterium marinum TaxID=1639118 RepID=UPI002A18B9D4|nr:lanthionine synthetase LanC family protein [Mangrovibacterium marinum]